MTKLFDTRMVQDLESHNYFGCESDGYSEQKQEALKGWWLEAMRQRGWILNETVICNDKEYLGEVFDKEDIFDHACQVCLEIAHDIVDSH